MNKSKRAQLQSAISHLEISRDIVDGVKDDEESCMSNMPESLQEGDRYSTMEDAVDSMDDAIDSIDDAIEMIKSAIG